MNEYDRYRRRLEQEAVVSRTVAWIIVICAAIGVVFVGWLLVSFVLVLL